MVHRLDRLSRSQLESVTLLQEFEKRGVPLVIATAPELRATAQDHLILNILASFAAFEREMIASRIAEVRAQLKSEGRRIAGAMPFGYEADRRSKQLLVNENEAAIVRWMFDQAAAGTTPAEMADLANSRGWRTKKTITGRLDKARGGNLWTARQVLATLRNPVYLGLFRDKKYAVRFGRHEAIVTDRVFAAAAEQLESRRTRTPGNRYHINWPLKGRIRCAACGTPMTPHTIPHGKWRYCYYRCRSTAGGRKPCGQQVSVTMIEAAVLKAIEMKWHLRPDANQIPDFVESVVYDPRDLTVRVTVIAPPDEVSPASEVQ